MSLKYRVGVDDSLDVFGVHLVGGVVSTLGEQVLGIVVAIGFSFTATYLLAMLVQRTVGLRVDPESEVNGLDTALHAESAYDHAGGRF